MESSQRGRFSIWNNEEMGFLVVNFFSVGPYDRKFQPLVVVVEDELNQVFVQESKSF